MKQDTTHPLDVWDCWELLQPTDWRSAVSNIAERLSETVDYLDEQRDGLGELIEQVTEQKVAMELDADVNEFRYRCVAVGAVLGYALARTWTSDLEGLTDWPARAQAFAHIDWPIETHPERKKREAGS